jgi:hypothetical protein
MFLGLRKECTSYNDLKEGWGYSSVVALLPSILEGPGFYPLPQKKEKFLLNFSPIREKQ